MKLVVNLDDQSDVERAKALLATFPTTAAGGRAGGGPAAPSAPAPTGSAPPPPPSAPAAPASPPAASPPAPPATAAAPPPAAPASPSSPPPPPPAAPAATEGVAKLNGAMQAYAKQYKAPATKARWGEMVAAVVASGNAAASNWKQSSDVPADMLDYAASWFAV